ncbi:MAG: hypothetical protein OK439_01900 [Thaumarchaeota archaeon]|nr:hypothetical protein [Nitrososphaerota archaeon]
MPRNRTKGSRLISHFAVAVVEPEFGLNVGYLARTMANFGLSKLFVVSQQPMDSENISRARLFAAHGRWLIDKIEYLDSFERLRRKYKLLIGTTAIEATRKSNLTRRTIAVDACAAKLAPRLNGGKVSCCFVFGRDSTGLTNDELKLCDYCLTIKTGSEYNTLNVSHAAAIFFYEFSKNLSKVDSILDHRPKRNQEGLIQTSTRNQRDRAIRLFERLGEDAEFKQYKRALLRETLKRMFGRGDPTLRELYLLMGLASKASSKIRRLSKVAA